MTEQNFSMCYRNWMNIYQLTPERASLQLHTILNQYYSRRTPPDAANVGKSSDPVEGGEPR